jgi:hypothetical protein
MTKSMKEQIEQLHLDKGVYDPDGFRYRVPTIYTLRIVALTSAGRIGFVVEDTSPDALHTTVDPSITIESVTVLSRRPAPPPPPPPPAPRNPLAPRLVRRA